MGQICEAVVTIDEHRISALDGYVHRRGEHNVLCPIPTPLYLQAFVDMISNECSPIVGLSLYFEGLQCPI